jgi:hypothetical protein
MNDPIVDEIRRVRDEYAAQFNYDLDAIYKDIKEREKRSGRKFVSYGPDGRLLTSADDAEVEPAKMGQPPAPGAGVPGSISSHCTEPTTT